MISFITGKIIDLDFVLVTVLTNGGVAYDIGINELIYSKLSIGEEVEFYTYHYITENNQTLFWFFGKIRKKVFSEIIKISGIGGKHAMQLLSLGIDRISIAVKNNDNKTLESVKGVGKKMAEKIILELKDKDFGVKITENVLQKSNNIDGELQSSIKSTLTNMGYNPRDIDKVLNDLPEEMTDAGDIIPYVIKSLS